MALLTPEALARVTSMELRARLIVEGFLTGLHRSPFHGFSVEFAEHRAYAAGDELRHVDWKAYGRNDRLVVKRYEEETNLRQTVVLDTSASMRYAGAAGVTKLTVAATLAAALHALMVRQRDATGLAAFDRAVHTFVRPATTRAHLARLFTTLDRLAAAPPPADAETGVAAALHDVAERLPRRGLVIVLSDLFDASGEVAETVRALQHLRHRGHEVVVFHILDAATERRFALPDAPVRVRDLESGEERTVLPAQIRTEVTAAAEAFIAEMQRRCREARVDYVPLDTAAPYADALRAYLDKRRRLF
ncbi:MAG TPA: DUF58 domain-containing protein [Rubricoccaceae bacterium]